MIYYTTFTSGFNCTMQKIFSTTTWPFSYCEKNFVCQNAMLNYKMKMCFSDEWRHKIKESHRTAKDFELENLG